MISKSLHVLLISEIMKLIIRQILPFVLFKAVPTAHTVIPYSSTNIKSIFHMITITILNMFRLYSDSQTYVAPSKHCHSNVYRNTLTYLSTRQKLPLYIVCMYRNTLYPTLSQQSTAL